MAYSRAGWALLASVLLAVPASAKTLTVVVPDSFALSKALVAKFERQQGVTLRFLKAGSAGAMVNRLILTRRHPLGDLVYGIDNTLIGKAVRYHLLARYRTPGTPELPPELQLLPTGYLTPINLSTVAITDDPSYFRKHHLPLPTQLSQLVRERYRGLLVMENPATSSTGRAFLLATVAHFGKSVWSFWQRLRENGLKVVNGWEAAYYTDFSKYGGSQPLVVSYLTDPAAEVYFAKTKLRASPVSNLLLPGSTFVQVEGAGLLRGGHHRQAAEAFLRFLLSRAAQSSIPTSMWVLPVVPGTTLNPVFRFDSKAPKPDQASSLQIAAHVQRWVHDWTAVVIEGEPASQVR